MELEDDFLDGNFEFPLECEPTAKQEARLTPKTTRKYATLGDIDSNIEEPDEKKARQKSQKNRGRKKKIKL